MKIAVVSAQVFPINKDLDYGGLEQVVFDLCECFVQMGHDVTLVAPKGSQIDGAKVIQTIEPKSKWGTEEENAWQIYKDKLNDYDIIFDHTHHYHPFKLGKPIVHCCHGLQTVIPPEAYNLVTLSEFHRKDTLQRFGKDSCVIPHGIDLEKYAFEPDKDDYYFHPGLIAIHKGHDITLRLAHSMPDVQFKIGGEDQFIPDPTYREWVIKHCEALDNVEYLGTLKDSSKIKLLQKAKAVLLPFQIGEAFSLLAIESLACGTPVVTSELGSMPEIIRYGVTGIMHKQTPHPWDLNYVSKIDPATCRNDAEERFGSKLMAERYVKVFREVLDGK